MGTKFTEKKTERIVREGEVGDIKAIISFETIEAKLASNITINFDRKSEFGSANYDPKEGSFSINVRSVGLEYIQEAAAIAIDHVKKIVEEFK